VVTTESQAQLERQIANIEDMITRKVDAIILTPASPTGVIPVLKKARAAGIKVILLAATIKSQDYDALVTVDDKDFGRVGAEWLAKQLGGHGKIIVLNGIAGLSVNDDRWNGAKAVFDKTDIKVVGSANADWDYAKAKVAVGNLLAAHSDIDGVWSQGGAMTLGAIDAFTAAKRKLVPMTGEDNNGFLKRWKVLAGQGFEAIGVSKPTWLGSEALLVALDLIDGKPTAKDHVFPPPVTTNADVDKHVRPDLSDSYWTNSRLSDADAKALFAD
jgi:ribose transport system substrate-binding protein